MLADPVEHISGIFQRSFRPAQRMTVDAWAEAYRTVFRPTPRPGPWSTDHVAYLREPMRDFTDPLVRRIVLMFGTQSGKTELILNCLGRLMDLDPDDTLLVIDSVDNARNFAKSRLLPMLRQNKRLSAYLPEKTLEDEGGRKKTERGKVTLQSLVLAEMTLWLTGSNSAGNLASKSVRTVLGDEIDKWPQVLGGRGGTEGSALQLMRERTRSYGDEAKEVIASTPTDEEVGIHKEFTATDQAEYHMPCPRCGQYQLLHFHADGRGGVRWEGGSGHDLSTRALAELAQRVRNTAWYECDHCGGRIESGEKSMMIMAGLWVRAGQRVEVKDPGKLVKLLAGPARAILARTGQSGMPEAVEQLPGAGVRLVGPKPMTDAHGYHASHLQSPFQTFGDMAARFVESRGEPGREWINSCLGEPYRKPGQRGDEQDLIELSRKTPDGEAPYQLGRVPRRAMCSGSRPLALIGSIDVQKDCVYYVVRGFGEREQAWLIDYGRVECPETMASGNSKQAVNEVVDEGTGEVMPVTTADPAIERLMADRWARVAELVSRTYQLHDGQDVAGMTPEPGAMPVRKWCIDARYRGREVLLFCQRMGAAANSGQLRYAAEAPDAPMLPCLACPAGNCS